MTKKAGFISPKLYDEITQSGTIQSIDKIPEHIKRLFVTSHDINAHWHIKIQAAFQKHTDSAVSKTINFPHDAKPEEIRDAYIFAYQNGCKGLTIYRYGSRDRQVLNIGEDNKEDLKIAPPPEAGKNAGGYPAHQHRLR